MRKKTIIYFILFALIAGFAVYLIMSRTNGTVKGVFRDFAVKDTAAITKIFLADKSGNTVLLERKSKGYWALNGKFKADNLRVKQLLECMKNVEMRSPVPKKTLDYVIKSMAVSNIKTEIYEGDKLIKTYFVGGNTQDELGTYMLMDNSTEPFAMWLPYFHGYLNIRYVPQAAEWRDKGVFTIQPNDIMSVEENYPALPDSSFAFKVKDNSFTVNCPSKPSKMPLQIEPARAKSFLVSFKDDYFEQVVKLSVHDVDSIAKMPTYADLIITSNTGKKEEMRIVLKKADQGTKLETKDLIDEEKYFAFLNGDNKDLVMLQKDAIKNCLGTFDDFK